MFVFDPGGRRDAAAVDADGADAGSLGPLGSVGLYRSNVVVPDLPDAGQSAMAQIGSRPARRRVPDGQAPEAQNARSPSIAQSKWMYTGKSNGRCWMSGLRP
jgi:hypothetical protein